MRFIHVLASAGLAAGLATAAPAMASGGPSTLEPGVSFQLGFGGHAAMHAGLRLRLAYAAGVLPMASRPALAEWSFDSSGADTLLLSGVPLYRGNLLAQDTDGGAPARTDTGTRVGMILLGAGAAAGLTFLAIGKAAKDNNPAVQDQNNGQTGVGCYTDPVSGGQSCAVGH